MNTPAHLIFGAAAFGRPGQAKVTGAAMLGGVLPDLSLYLMVAWAQWIQGYSPREVFGRLYFSDGWMAVFAVDNSIPLWGMGFALALWLRRPVLVALTGAALLHLGFDFMLHGPDARPQFWPLTDWKFDSPYSYWDRSRHAGLIGPAEMLISAVLTGFLVWRHRSTALRLVLALLLTAEVVSAGGWHFFM